MPSSWHEDNVNLKKVGVFFLSAQIVADVGMSSRKEVAQKVRYILTRNKLPCIFRKPEKCCVAFEIVKCSTFLPVTNTLCLPMYKHICL